MLELFLEKYSDTLSQDILFLLKNSGIGKRYPEIVEKIIYFYKKEEHSNLYNFLYKMKSIKNIIYTFSDINEPLLADISNELETELFGKISKNNIIEIQMSSINDEDELEEFLANYLEKENNCKIIIFKFNDENKKLLNFIIYFIENFIKEEKNYKHENNQIVFIFIVHMTRILEKKTRYSFKRKSCQKTKEKECNSIILDDQFEEYAPNSVDLYKIFIDDLNGEDISFIDIINLKEDENSNLNQIMNEDNRNHLYIEEGVKGINTILLNNYNEIINKHISMLDFLINNIENLNIESI